MLSSHDFPVLWNFHYQQQLFCLHAYENPLLCLHTQMTTMRFHPCRGYQYFLVTVEFQRNFPVQYTCKLVCGLRFQSHFPKSNPSFIWECKRITQENTVFEKTISEVLNLKMNVLLPGVRTKIQEKNCFFRSKLWKGYLQCQRAMIAHAFHVTPYSKSQYKFKEKNKYFSKFSLRYIQTALGIQIWSQNTAKAFQVSYESTADTISHWGK